MPRQATIKRPAAAQPAAAEGEHDASGESKKQRKQSNAHPLVPAWTHAALNSSCALTSVYAEIRKVIGAPQGRAIRVVTALPNTLSPMPSVMHVMPEAHYVMASIYSKSHAGYALVGKNTADHVYTSLPFDSAGVCLRHDSCSCDIGAADLMLSSSECSRDVLDDVAPGLACIGSDQCCQFINYLAPLPLILLPSSQYMPIHCMLSHDLRGH